MKDEKKKKKQLIQELAAARKRIEKLEAAENAGTLDGHKQAEQKLQLFQNLINRTSDALFLIDPETSRFLHVNEKTCANLGYTHEELLSMSVTDIEAILPDHFSWAEHVKKLKKTGQMLLEGRHKRKDGSEFPVAVNVIYIETPHKHYVVAVVRDLIERRQAEDILKLLKEAVETLPIGITISDLDGKIIYMNPAEAEIHGYTEAELIGNDARILAPKDTWEPVAFDRLHAMGVRKRESINIRKTGEVFPVQLISRAVTNAEGKPIGIITACEDVTDRKQAEEKLKQRQEALNSVYRMAISLESSFESVCDEVVQNVSRLLGVSHVTILRREQGRTRIVSGIADGKVVIHETLCPESCACISVYETKQVSRMEGPLDKLCPGHPFADDRLNGMLAVPIIETSSAVVGAINVLQRGKEKFSENQIHLIEIFARYIAFVIEREATEERLRNAQKMELIGKLAGGVAHEVRNPLNAIMAISESLSRDLGGSDEYKPFLDHIKAQVDRLSTLMRDLLDLGKPVEQFRFQREPLVDICSASIDIWKHSGSSTSREAKLTIPTGGGNSFVHAYSHRLQQVFINLLENAAQHSSDNGDIEMVVSMPSDGMVRADVVDHGTGVSEEYLPNVFDPFFSTRKGGTGLGMSIVKHIVEAHGGTVDIMNNDPPPGCTVIVRLPDADKEQDETEHTDC